jgi:hypothetical protein
MSIKTKAPEIKEDPTTKKLREQAEARAETDRRQQGQSYADSATRKILRRFGMTAQAAGAGGIAGFNPFVLGGLGLGGSGTFGGESGGNAPNFIRSSSDGRTLSQPFSFDL